MKKTLRFFMAAFLPVLLTPVVFGQVQQHVWYLPDQQVNFTSGTPVVTASPSTGIIDPLESNGVHDANGNMIMKVVEGTVLNRYGQTIGYLQDYKSRGYAFDMAIVPVKNELCSYYIIYLDQSLNLACCVNGNEPCCNPGTVTRYSKVDLAANNGQGAFVSNGVTLHTTTTRPPEGIAVSRADGSGNRFLYLVKQENPIIVRRYLITNTGISFQAQFTAAAAGLTGYDFGEVELSHDGSMLALSSGSAGKVYMMYLYPATGTLNTTLGTAGVSIYTMPSSGDAFGLEFTPDNSRLFVSDAYTTGIRYITLSSGVISAPVSGTTNWGNTYLELAYDPGGNHQIGTISGANKLGLLSAISATPAFTNTGITVYGGDDTFFRGIWRMPKQIDGEDYTARFTSVPPATVACCAFADGIDVQTYNVTSTQTWNGTNPINGSNELIVGQELRVKTGAYLTINNITVRFLEQAKLVIEPGARLTINGTTHLTSTDCNTTMWKGVELQGNYLLSQTTANQGWIYLNSGTQISNAINGIRAIGMLSDGVTFDWAKTGGVIRATGATFRNNKRDVEYLGYSFANSGSFTNCTFIIDAALNNGQVPYGRVSMNAVKGITFRGCDFRNTTSGLYPASQRGYGIISIDAGYSVDFHCTVTVPAGTPCPSRDISVFEGFVYGINSSASSTNYTSSIRYSSFFGNQYDVYLSGISLPVIVENTFETMDPTAFGGFSPVSVGLYLDRCTGYQVENNYFFHDEPPAGILSYGILVNNSNNNGAAADVNQVYNNDFNGLVFGAVSTGVNAQLLSGNAVSNTGLTYKCNDFVNTRTADLYFSGQVSPFQGTCLATAAGLPQAPANNRFSVPASTWDIYNTMGTVFQVDYRYSTSTTEQTAPRAGLYLTTNTTTSPCTALPAYSSSSCPRKSFDGSKLIMLERSTVDHEQESQRKLALIDGGDRGKMLSMVYATDGDKLESGLRSYAPYLSDEVLVAVVRRAPVVSSQTVYAVLKANAPLSIAVLQSVEESALSETVKKALWAEAGISPVQELLTQIAYHRHEIELAANEAARQAVHAENAGEYTGGIPGKELTQGDMELKNMMDRMVQAPDGIFVLLTDEALRANVEALAARKDNSREAVRAAMILQYVFGTPYEPGVPEMPTKKGAEETKSPQAVMTSAAADILAIYPNPAQNMIFVECGLKGMEKAAVKIYAINGSLLVDTYISGNQAQVNVETLPNGVYMIRLTMPDGSLKVNRMVIQK